MRSKRFLIYGYGNPGRQDDGLGVMIADELEKWAVENKFDFIEFDSNYQLNIEDADRIANFDYVVFTDASVAQIDSHCIEKISPDMRTDFSMHSVVPAFVVGLCEQIFGKYPQSYQMHIKGYDFDFMKKPTDQALENLEKATQELKDFILQKSN